MNDVDKNLIKILSDKKSGSTELALKLNSYFKNIPVEPDKIFHSLNLIKEHFNLVIVPKYKSLKLID